MKHVQYGLIGLLTLSLLYLAGCGSVSKVRMGDTVEIQYVSSFSDGTLFESSQRSFVVGSHTAISGLENGVIGMKVGQTKYIDVPPAQGYGDRYNPLHLQKISKLLFDKMTDSMEGQAEIRSIAGVTGVVKGIEKDAEGNDIVLRDINPRETWQNISYKVTLVSKK